MAVITAPVIACSRLRVQTDGQGITTLVGFHGCPLRCKWCLNPFSFAPDTRYTAMTPQMLYEQVRKDELYFLSTGGGVTFGGGEPLLYPEFLQQFREICGKDWHLCAETSLQVPWVHVEQAARSIDHFIIDCKDTDPDIYRAYTGQENSRMLQNLKRLMERTDPNRVTVRVPLIPEYNTEESRQRSKELLLASGVTQLEFFTYRTGRPV